MSAVANPFSAAAQSRWGHLLSQAQARATEAPGVVVEGVLRRVVGLTLEASGCRVQLGGRCKVIGADGVAHEAEVVGFAGDRTYLMPTGDMHGLLPDARVVPLHRAAEAQVGDELLGRVLDGEGRPLDALPRPRCTQRVRINGTQINPLQRAPIREPLDVGVRAINALLTVGRGQRIGLFAGTGVGKSTLLGMMTRYTTADVVVVGLVGERGREVRDFIDNCLGPEGLRRAVVVATPSDQSPLMRLRGAALATAIAEHFREQGKQVLLLMDSLTRYAQAQREIGLAVGEPPATRGYPPSVFAKLPKLVERAGNGADGRGSITAFYTVLTEGDDPNDPIADAARGILDGHILLSRSIADAGIYPAIDIESSVSRVAHEITPPTQRERVRRFHQLFSAYQRNRDLIAIGAYKPGSDARTDAAIALWPRIEDFLRQDVHQAARFDDCLRQLGALLDGASPAHE